MGIRTIPAVEAIKWEVCDKCGADEEQIPEKFGHQSIDLHVGVDLLDFQGNPCADASFKALLCVDCRVLLADFLGRTV